MARATRLELANSARQSVKSMYGFKEVYVQGNTAIELPPITSKNCLQNVNNFDLFLPMTL